MRQQQGKRRAPPRSPGWVLLLRNPRFLLFGASVLLILILLISTLVNSGKRSALEKEVARLETAAAQLEEEKTQLNAQLTEQGQLAAAARQEVSDLTRAMDLFWQIDEAYVLSRHSRARELIRILEAEALAAVLPTTSTTDNGRFSPYDRYAEICEALQEPYGAGVETK